MPCFQVSTDWKFINVDKPPLIVNALFIVEVHLIPSY